MRKLSIRVAMSLLCIASGAAQAQRTPAFEDCPATIQQIHKTPRLIFDAPSRHYHSAIERAVQRSPNFAGHFVMAEWGCGAGCVMAATIDMKTGHVTSLPFTVSDWPLEVTEPLTYHADSCMLIVQGSRNESKERGTWYYVFDGKTFRLRASAAPSSD